MNVDSKFSKTGKVGQVACNYASVAYTPYSGSGPIRLRVNGPHDGPGDLQMHMNALEAHRLVQELNDALSLHTKGMLSKAGSNA